MGDAAANGEESLRQVRTLEARLAEVEETARVYRHRADRYRDMIDLQLVEEERRREAGNREGLGRFAHGVAHDLNNLLVTILGNTGLALMDLPDVSPCRPLIQEVGEAAQRAADLTNEMLAYSDRGIDSGSVAIGPRTVADDDWRGEGLILVVDDEEMIRRLAKRVLERFGFQVMVAEDGDRALEIFRPHAADIVVVLLDVTMPYLDGAETFRQLRRIRPDVKVLLSSGFDEGQATRKIAVDQLAGFLPKPYLPMDLVQRMRQVVEGE